MSRAVKRVADLVLASVGLVLLLPVLALASLAIWVTMGRPILFRHVRPGYCERLFTVLKFRTMREAYDEAGQPLPDAERLTPVGRFLRSTSLDELPQLWNVVKGEMSLVGPRPLYPVYLERYTPRQRRRHEVKPGITGWAQVNGRNELSWPERLELDVWYVDHWSLWLDLRILLRTVVSVLRREGIAEPGGVTMSEFRGADD